MKLGLIKEAEKYENEEREREFSRLKISEDETIRCNELLKSLESVLDGQRNAFGRVTFSYYNSSRL